jgi:hypothetical protein
LPPCLGNIRQDRAILRHPERNDCPCMRIIFSFGFAPFTQISLLIRRNIPAIGTSNVLIRENARRYDRNTDRTNNFTPHRRDG